MSLTPGTRLGVYEVTAQIGEGGMGQVYRATDTRLKRQVAIKILPPSVAADADRLGRFQREAEVLASLNHPNIAAIHGLEESGGITALVMELVEGDDLSQRIARGAIPIDEALPIAKQIAEALEAAHEQGIIHRDLKPANIKVRADGTVKVLDFGLAKAMDPVGAASASVANSPTLSVHATMHGVILGTAAYMAPEQARGKAVDRRADIWAFGVVLYEMLTGTRAFKGDDISDLLASVLKDEVKWDALPTGLPAPIRRLLRRCLEKDPKRRLSSIADARLELDEHEAPAQVAAAAPTSRRWVAIASGAVVGAIATAGAFLWLAAPKAPTASNTVTRLSMILPADIPVPTYRALGTLSPNGRFFAYVAGAGEVGGSEGRVWVRPLDGTEARPIAGTEGANAPFWSPDSRTIGFFADGKLKKVPIDGGSPETICAAASGRSGAWTDGAIVFAPGSAGPLMRVSPGGGDPVAVTTPDAARGESAHRFAKFLPDGRHFLYVILPAKAGKFEIAIGSLDAPGRRILMTAESAPTYAAPGYLLFASRNRIVAQPFDATTLQLSGEPAPIGDQTGDLSRGLIGGPVVSSSRDGLLAYLTAPPVKTKLGWFDLSGKELSTINTPEGLVIVTSLSRDDTRASLRQSLPDGEEKRWILNLDRGDLVRFATGAGIYENFVWSRDGSRLVFSHDQDGPWDLYAVALAAPAVDLPILKNSDLFKYPSDWSPDGKYIVYGSQNGNTKSDVFLLPVEGDLRPRPYVQTPADESYGVVSPDGRWLAYHSNESGANEVYVQPFPTPGVRHRVGPGEVPIWNRTGTMLSWIDEDHVKLWVTDVRPGPEFQASAPRVLGVVPPNTRLPFFLRSDFTRVLAAVPTGNSGGPSVTIVSNWLAALGKK